MSWYKPKGGGEKVIDKVIRGNKVVKRLVAINPDRMFLIINFLNSISTNVPDGLPLLVSFVFLP